MKTKIFFYYMLLIVVGVSITGFFTSKLAQKFYESEVEEKLRSTGVLLMSNIHDDTASGLVVDYNQYAKKYSDILKSAQSTSTIEEIIRITFIDYNGNVIGDSNSNILEMDNHLDRAEIQEALKGKIGKAKRLSATLHYDSLYIAMPFKEQNLFVRVSVPLTQLKHINEIIWAYTIVGVFAGIILTALLAYLFSSSLVKPINSLIKTSQEFSQGNYAMRAQVVNRDELGQLAYTFNNMANKIERNMQDLTDKNHKVDAILNSLSSGLIAVDNSCRIILANEIACKIFNIKNGPGIIGMNFIDAIRNNQINVYLKSTIEFHESTVNELPINAPDERILRVFTTPIKSDTRTNSFSGGIVSVEDITNIKKLEQIRTEFVSNVTHELKTPLTSIRGFIETLRGGAIDDPNVSKKFLEIIDIEAERLYILINDILQLSEIESKQKDRNIGIYQLKPIVAEVISIMESAAQKKSIALEWDVDENAVMLINKDRIKQMLINLIDNAIKYNTPNSSVSVFGHCTNGKVVIIVSDTGIGIPQEHLSRIFERFYRVDKGRSRSMGGTGLGLSIVKHIVNLYDGDINVSSSKDGTKFTIQLPAHDTISHDNQHDIDVIHT